MAQLIRKKGSPDEAAAVLPYEKQLVADLEDERAHEQPELSLAHGHGEQAA